MYYRLLVPICLICQGSSLSLAAGAASSSHLYDPQGLTSESESVWFLAVSLAFDSDSPMPWKSSTQSAVLGLLDMDPLRPHLERIEKRDTHTDTLFGGSIKISMGPGAHITLCLASLLHWSLQVHGAAPYASGRYTCMICTELYWSRYIDQR